MPSFSSSSYLSRLRTTGSYRRGQPALELAVIDVALIVSDEHHVDRHRLGERGLPAGSRWE